MINDHFINRCFKFKQVYYSFNNISREEMLGSKSFKNQGRSTGVSLKSSSSSVSGKKDNFFTFLYKRIYALLMKLWGKTRSMLWIGSTGFILLIIPFSFLYLTEMEKHSMKMMEGKNKNNFRSRNALIHIHNSYSISYYDSIFTFCIFLHEIEIKPSAIKNLLYHTLIYRFKGINHMKIYLPLPFNFIKNDGDLLENGLNGFAGRKNDSAKTTFMKFLQEDSRISSIIKFQNRIKKKKEVEKLYFKKKVFLYWLKILENG